MDDMNTYPHMCRMGHEQIGHREDTERCPVCKREDHIKHLRRRLQEAEGSSERGAEGYLRRVRTEMWAIVEAAMRLEARFGVRVTLNFEPISGLQQTGAFGDPLRTASPGKAAAKIAKRNPLHPVG